MKTTLFLASVGVAVLGITLWPGTSSPHIAAGDAKGKQGVDLPKHDPLLQAIQKRFGKPDRVTGSGRAFIHYGRASGSLRIVFGTVGSSQNRDPDRRFASEVSCRIRRRPPRDAVRGAGPRRPKLPRPWSV
jgi:hypothetical protein